jgi:hypothetical protein
VFASKDSWPAKRLGTRRLDCVFAIRGGKVVYVRGPAAAGGQDTTIYDLLLKKARIGGRREALDIGVIGNRIARIGPGLKAAHARVVIETEGYEIEPAALAESRIADLTLLDASRAILTVRSGKIIRDDQGLSVPDVIRAGPYTNFK